MISGFKSNILLVDDNPQNLMVMKTILENPEYHVVTAKSGTEALKLLLDQDFAVVLLDVMMPVMNGFDTARMIRNRQKTKCLPIIFTTAYSADETSVFSGYAVGAVDYILTPIVPEILKAKVEVFVELFRKSEEIVRQEKRLRDLERAQYEKEREAERLLMREQYLLKEREQERIATQRLERQAKMLAESNADLERFAYVVSHDLQEPLNTISSYCELLEENSTQRLHAEDLDFLRFIRSGVQRMRGLVRSLLIFSKVKRDHEKVHMMIDTHLLFEKMLGSLATLMKDKNARVTFGPLPKIVGDEFRLTQLFQNLVTNAIKFQSQRDPVVHVDAVKREGVWEFCVSDNGIGIDPKYFDQIFVMFKRLHGGDQFEGTGMGLALCKKIVENFGGKIWVESTPNEGSRFYFTFPANEDAKRVAA
jgi:signal transduction histidine kinase